MPRTQEEPRIIGSQTVLSPMLQDSNHIPYYNNPRPLSNQPTHLDIVQVITDRSSLPKMPDEQIGGILRQGGKLVVTGASKSGKSFLMIELAIAVATGTLWCGFPCKPGRVLIANLEIREEQFMHRLADVIDALQVDRDLLKENLYVLNLRGKIHSIDQLAESLSNQCATANYSMVIIDPMYKVQNGAENEARSITEFCSQLDRIANELACSIAYCHHHSKGSQGWKASEDRASGSGVIARDADALIDMMELQTKEDESVSKGVPFRLEFVLRDFKEPDPVNLRCDYPIHKLDSEGTLTTRQYAGVAGSKRRRQTAQKLANVENVCDLTMGDRDEMPRLELDKKLGMDKRTIAKYIEQSNRFGITCGSSPCMIYRIKPET